MSRFFALSPLWLLIYSWYEARTFSGSSGDVTSKTLGAAITGLEMFWMLIGLYVLWNARSMFVEALAYIFFTIPAIFAVMFAPALVLIMQNLG